MPQTLELVHELRGDFIPAVVSGAGPAVLAFGTVDTSALSARCPQGWVTHALAIESDGVRLLA